MQVDGRALKKVDSITLLLLLLSLYQALIVFPLQIPGGNIRALDHLEN